MRKGELENKSLSQERIVEIVNKMLDGLTLDDINDLMNCYSNEYDKEKITSALWKAYHKRFVVCSDNED